MATPVFCMAASGTIIPAVGGRRKRLTSSQVSELLKAVLSLASNKTRIETERYLAIWHGKDQNAQTNAELSSAALNEIQGLIAGFYGRAPSPVFKAVL